MLNAYLLLAVIAVLLVTVTVLARELTAQARLNCDSRDQTLVRHLQHYRTLEEDKLIMTEQLLREAGRNVSLVRPRLDPLHKSENAFKHGWKGSGYATTPEQDKQK